MSQNALTILIWVVWVFVALIVMGAMREVERRWSPVGLMWPFAVAIGAVFAIGWCIAWIGRGPARLAIRHERRRRQAKRIARAEVRR